MEYNIYILDSFPSLNKLPQKNNLYLEFNNKEYLLNKLITQQKIISCRRSSSRLYFKIFFSYNNKKTLFGISSINTDFIKFDNKYFITWVEFKKKYQDNSKEMNDINFFFYDCIRLKLSITLTKPFPKSDKRVKKTKSKIKIGAITPIIPKKEELKFIYNNNDFIGMNNNEDNENDNELNSYRENNNGNINLIKSKSEEGNVKLITEENKLNNNFYDKFNNLRLNHEENIAHEIKDLLSGNDCLLTDNNLIENYSYSTSLGDNNNKNIIFKNNNRNNKIENVHNNLVTEIKKENINYKNILISPNDFNKLENESINYNQKNQEKALSKSSKKLKIVKSKFNNINKYNKTNDVKQQKKFKKIKINTLNKSNSNKDNIIIREKIYFNSNTYNNFYKNKKVNEKFNYNNNLKEENNLLHLDTNINTIINENKIKNLNEILISKEIEKNNDIIKVEKNKKYEDKYNEINYEEFISIKKDYDLLYTSSFIKEIKKDLLDLEFNIALEKSISLFLLYNDQISIFFNQKKELINLIKNYSKKTEFLYKKINLLNAQKRKNELKQKNKILLENSDFNLKGNYLKQKDIFEKLINNRINRKSMLKSIISILMKKKQNLLNNIQTKKSGKETINNNELYHKYVIKSPSRSVKKFRINSPQTTKVSFKQSQKYEFMSEIKAKNLIYSNKRASKKKPLNKVLIDDYKSKNLKKNKSINYFSSIESMNERNNDKNYYIDTKVNLTKNNLLYH